MDFNKVVNTIRDSVSFDKIASKKLLIGFVAGGLALWGVSRIINEAKSKIKELHGFDFSKRADKHTLSNYDEITTSSLEVRLALDFAKKRFFGSVTLNMVAAKDGVSVVDLDISGIDVLRIVDGDGAPLWFDLVNVNQLKDVLGLQLKIFLSGKLKKNDTISVTIHYSTSPDASGICWLEPPQTFGKGHPFVYTTGKPIFTRTFLPCQDTPQVRSSYTAEITTPIQYTVYMSADCTNIRTSTTGMRSFHFSQKSPIPSHLIALVAGNLEFRPIGQRCGVISEPESVTRYEMALADLELYERRVEIPYSWRSFNIVIIPNVLHVNALPNPQLALLSSSSIAKEKPLLELLVDMLTQRWTGGLVTSANWEGQLMEGLATYMTRKTIEALTGKELYETLNYIGYQNFILELEALKDRRDLTKLVPNLSHINPAFHSVTSIQREKGNLLLIYLEMLIGGKYMKEMVKGFLTNCAFKSISFCDFKQAFVDYVSNHVPEGSSLLTRVNWDDWLNQPGLPSSYQLPTKSEKIDKLERLAERYVELKGEVSPSVLEIGTVETSNTEEIIIFLNWFILRKELITYEIVERLDNDFWFHSKHKDMVVLSKWFTLCAHVNYREAYPSMEKFMSRTASVELTRPVYEALQQSDCGFAETMFLKTAVFHHRLSNDLIASQVIRTPQAK